MNVLSGAIIQPTSPPQSTGYSSCRKHYFSRYPHGSFIDHLQVFSLVSLSQQGQPWLPYLEWQQPTTPHPYIPDSLLHYPTLPALTFAYSPYHLPTYYNIYSFLICLPTLQCVLHEVSHFCLVFFFMDVFQTHKIVPGAYKEFSKCLLKK